MAVAVLVVVVVVVMVVVVPRLEIRTGWRTCVLPLSHQIASSTALRGGLSEFAEEEVGRR